MWLNLRPRPPSFETASYLLHYHRQRNHQGLENKLIDAVEDVGQSQSDVRCDEHLGGVLKDYYRKAA